MSEDWETNSDEEDDFSSGFIFKGEELWIQGVRITSFNCPGCLGAEYDANFDDDEEESLLYEESDCQLCEFFEPDTCLFRKYTSVLQDVRTLFDVYCNKHSLDYQRYLEHREKLVNAILAELKNHGRPLHYTVLTEIVRQRYPELIISAPRILRTMAHRPHIFMKVDEGVYCCTNDNI